MRTSPTQPSSRRTSLAERAGLWALTFGLIAGVAFADTDPGRIEIDDITLEISEGAGMLVVTVERESGDDGIVSVDYATADGSATAGVDYESTNGTLTWGDGDDEDKTFLVSILEDDETEGDETFVVTLSMVTGGAELRPDRSVATVTLEDNDVDDEEDNEGEDEEDDDDDGENDDEEDNDDGEDDDRAGVLKFDQRTFRSAEGTGMAVVTVERSRGESGEVSVFFATSDGTAIAGTDYESTSGTLVWANGDESPQSFVVTLLPDSEGEADETVELMLSDPTGGATIDPVRGTAVLTIVDDDGGAGDPGDDDARAGVIKLDERSFEVIEGDTMAVITVERSMGQRGAVTVDYATGDGSAENGVDYQGVSGTLSWGPGDGSNRTFTVPIFDDDLSEGTETVNLLLGNPTGGASLDRERGQGILEILDQDADDSIACTPGPDTLCFQQGRFEAEITWRGFDGTSGRGRAVEISDTSGLFWFFDASNIEVLLKTVDACDVEGLAGYWVFFAATTSVDFTLRLTDTRTGLSREYTNLLGKAALPVQDVTTFSCR